MIMIMMVVMKPMIRIRKRMRNRTIMIMSSTSKDTKVGFASAGIDFACSLLVCPHCLIGEGS